MGGKKEDWLRFNEGMQTWGKTCLAYKQKSVGALLFDCCLKSKGNSEIAFIPPFSIPIQSFHPIFHDIENTILAVQKTKMAQV